MDMPVSRDVVTNLNWRKSARSINAGNCTEVASTEGAVLVKDSQDPNSLQLKYSTATWRTFIHAARTGNFDVTSCS